MPEMGGLEATGIIRQREAGTGRHVLDRRHDRAHHAGRPRRVPEGRHGHLHREARRPVAALRRGGARAAALADAAPRIRSPSSPAKLRGTRLTRRSGGRRFAPRAGRIGARDPGILLRPRGARRALLLTSSDRRALRAAQAAPQRAQPIKAGEVPARKHVAPLPPRGTFVPPRTPWGDPDIAGDYNNSDESGIPFERPDEFAGRRMEDITPAELAKLVQQRQEQTIERTPGLSEFPGATSPMHWFENYYAANSRPWLVDRTGRRQGAAADRRGAAAGTGAAAGARRPRSGRLVGGSQPLRPLHHPRHPRIDDAGHLRQLVPHPAGARVRHHHLRDGARHARDPARRPRRTSPAASASTWATRAAAGKATRW